MEQVVASSFSQSTRNYVQGSRRSRIGVPAVPLPSLKHHSMAERQRLLTAPSQAATNRKNLLKRSTHTTSAVQQQVAAPTDVSATNSDNEDFLISQGQLRQLAETKDAPLFEGASFANVFQLANALRTSLEFGLVTDAQDLKNRAAVFGCNTLPSKEEVSLT